MSTFDVAVVGLGVIGAACARELARAGLRVVAFDPRPPGSEASRAAFGQIAPRVEPGRPAALLELWRASQALFPGLIAALAEESGDRVEYNPCGRIALAFDSADVAALERVMAEQQAAAVPVEWLGADAVRDAEPAVAADVLGGLLYRENHAVDNGHLTEALGRAAAAAGAELRIGERITGLERAGGRVVGVRLGETTIAARHVILAAGAWSGQVDPAHPCPIRPRRGQGVAFQLEPGTLRRMLSWRDTLVVHRATGRTIVGVTSEDVGFERAVTAAALHRFLAEALRAIPVLGEGHFLDTWSGFRPVMPDDLPVIGADPRHDGLIWATGHLGVGVALAPITAAIVRDLILEHEIPFDLRSFRAGRW